MFITQIQTVSFESSKKEVFFLTLQIFAASLFLAFCSRISIPLYFTPVPLTGQTFGVMLIGATLGRRLGLLSILAYLIEGSLGLPVFMYGQSGLMHVLGTTGGYLLGFMLQAYFIGRFMERQKSFHGIKIMSILLLSSVLQLGLGSIWLSHFVGLEAAIVMGFYPFILGELLKVVGLTAYLKTQYSST